LVVIKNDLGDILNYQRTDLKTDLKEVLPTAVRQACDFIGVCWRLLALGHRQSIVTARVLMRSAF